MFPLGPRTEANNERATSTTSGSSGLPADAPTAASGIATVTLTQADVGQEPNRGTGSQSGRNDAGGPSPPEHGGGHCS